MHKIPIYLCKYMKHFTENNPLYRARLIHILILPETNMNLL